jgi:CHAT domain-containing protein
MHVKKVIIKHVSLFVLLQTIFLLLPLQISGLNFNIQESLTDSLFENYLFNAEFNKAFDLLNQLTVMISNNNVVKIKLLIHESELYMEKGDLITATQLIEKAEIVRNTLTKTNLELDFHFALQKGILLNKLGQNTASYKSLTEARKIMDVKKKYFRKDAAKLFANMGIICFETCDSSNAFRYFNMAINEASISNLQGKIIILTSLSYLQLAGYYFNRPNIVLNAKRRNNLLFDSVNNSDHPAMTTYYLNMISIYLNLEYEMLLASQTMDKVAYILKRYYNSGYYKYGLLFYYQGQFAYIIQDYEKALGYLKQSDNYLVKNPNIVASMFQTNFLIGTIYLFYKKEYKLSIQYYNKVLQSKNKWEKASIVKCYLLSGYAYMALDDTLKAIALASKGIEMLKKINSGYMVNSIAYAYRCISGIYQDIGKKDSASFYLFKAYEFSTNYNVDKNLKAMIYRDLGFYYKSKGDYKQALQKYQQALILCSKEFKDTTILANPEIANIASEEIMIETLNMKAFVLYLLYNNSKMDTGILDAALKCHEISVKILEKRIINLDNENSEFKFFDKIKASYNNAVSYSTLLYKITGNISYAEKAFEFAEKSKMMVMLMHTYDKNAKKYAGIPDTLIAKESQLHNEILNIQNRIYQIEQDDFSTSEKKILIDRLAKAQFDNDQLASYFKRHYQRYYDLRYSRNVLSIAQIQHLIKKDQVLLEYQLLTSELIIFVISKTKFSIRLIPHQGGEMQQIINLRKLVAESPLQKDANVVYREFISTSHSLFSWLISPIFHEINGKKLIIVPHNELNLIPFDLLIPRNTAINDSGNYKALDYLICHCPLSYAYSGTLLFDYNPERKPIKKLALFLPDCSKYDKEYSKNLEKYYPIMGAKEEVDAVRRFTQGDLFTGDQATESNFKSASPKYDVIHIVSHTQLNDQIPTLSSLVFRPDSVLQEDGLLHSFELYQMQLNAKLVVLSGCNTGMGRLQLGEGLLSLGRSFFYTGVRSLVYTLWPVADKSSAKLISIFYSQLVKNKGLEISLQSAKIQYLAEADPAKSHPFYWASYQIVGKVDSIQLNKWNPVMFISVFVFIMGGYYILIIRKVFS